ncbi:MAG TPA: Fic family protein [Candidatus Bilamarchaeaceae archaeon]|nr:Fic family protein [Candidatus Bilamarchaeaceae archaeon]
MVTIKKKIIEGQEYYYLEHSFRNEGKVEKKEQYLGKKIPKNIEEIKNKLLHEVYTKKWYALFDKIKERHIKEQKTIPESIKEKELQSFAIRFTYDTNRIEGSKLTLRDTANLLEKGISPKEKPIKDIKEAEAHRDLFYEMLNYKKDLNLQTVLYWHKKLLERTKLEIAGKFREYQVAISGSKFLPPSPIEVYPLMKEFFGWYDKNKSKLNHVELAALVHLKFVTIHPFGDGNGRISRLMMNFVLNKYGFPMLDIKYERRSSYYTALERAQVKKNEIIFLNWFFRQYLKENKKYLK